MKNELELLRIFRVAAECENFRQAAIQLSASPQGVTRAIQSLENHYGELLFHRNTRQVRITAFGSSLLEQLRPLLAQFDSVWQTPGEDEAAFEYGSVRITAPHSLGSRAVLPALQRVALKHPKITLDLRLTDGISNTVDDGIDVGVRVGFLRDSGFVARKAADMRLPVVAAPQLIERVGVPHEIADLAELPLTAALDINTGRHWPWYFKEGHQWVPDKPVFIADNADMELGVALAGIAFAQLPDYLVASHIESGELVQVLQAEETPAWGLYIYRPQRGPVPQRVRAVFDALFEAVKAMPVLP